MGDDRAISPHVVDFEEPIVSALQPEGDRSTLLRAPLTFGQLVSHLSSALEAMTGTMRSLPLQAT